MEIGGYDIIVATANPQKLAEQIMSWMNWPDAVIEKDEGEDFFYYKDQAAKDSWEEDIGLDNTMLYFLLEPGQLTVVADKESADEIKAQIKEISSYFVTHG